MPCDAWWIFAENGEGDAIVDREYPGEPVQIKTSPSLNASYPISLTCAEKGTDYEFVEKVAKKLREKVYQRKSDRKTEFFFYFYYCVQKFSAWNFFCIFFLLIRTQRFMIPILNFCKQFCLLILALFLTFRTKTDETAQKSEKHIFCKCVLESSFTSIFVVGGSILSKKYKKHCTPLPLP